VNRSPATVHRMDHPWRWQRQPLQQFPQVAPPEARSPASPVEPLPPGPHRYPHHPVQPGTIPGYPVVRVVAEELLAECLVLLPDRSVTVPPTPFRYRLGEPADSAGCRATADHLVPLPRLPPVMGEAQKVERPGPVPGLRLTPVASLRGPLERHQPRLVRVNGQAVLAEPLRQDFQNTPRVLLVLEADHEVVRVADQEGTSLQTRLHLLEPPVVQHVVQVDVGQQR